MKQFIVAPRVEQPPTALLRIDVEENGQIGPNGLRVELVHPSRISETRLIGVRCEVVPVRKFDFAFRQMFQNAVLWVVERDLDDRPQKAQPGSLDPPSTRPVMICRTTEPTGPVVGSDDRTTPRPLTRSICARRRACVLFPDPSRPSITMNAPCFESISRNSARNRIRAMCPHVHSP